MRFLRLMGSGVLAAAVLVAAGPMAGAVDSALEAIKARKAIFDGNKNAMQAIKGVLDAGLSLEAVVAHARSIEDGARRLPALFPAGSEKGGDTKARPEIWMSMDDFEVRLTDLGAKAQTLAAAAAAGDQTGVAAAFRALGGACKGCHDEYKD